MVKKRDFILEIESIRSNLLENKSRINQAHTRWFDVTGSLVALDKLPPDFPETKKLVRTIANYAPICAVACLEGYFRLLIRDLIDYGLPFSVNAQEFKDVKLNLVEINAIWDKRVTVGEFIAHLLPINNLSDINSHMTVLLGEDLIKLVRHSSPNGRREGNQILPESRVFEELSPNMISDIVKIFELRHTLCHELATAYPVSIEDIELMYFNIRNFINTVEYLMTMRMQSAKT